jgi:hypothetical protein
VFIGVCGLSGLEKNEKAASMRIVSIPLDEGGLLESLLFKHQ